MGRARWLILAAVGLTVGASWLFRATHPLDATISDIEWAIRLGHTDALRPQAEMFGQHLASRPQACVALAWKLFAHGEKETAARLTEAAWGHNPFQAEFLETALAIRMDLGQKAAASSLLTPALRRELPLSENGRQLAASMLAQTENYAEAERILRALLASHPEDPTLLQELGDVYNAQHKFAEAVDCFRKALSLAPQNTRTRLALARSLSWDAMQVARQKLYADGLAANE